MKERGNDLGLKVITSFVLENFLSPCLFPITTKTPKLAKSTVLMQTDSSAEHGEVVRSN